MSTSSSLPIASEVEKLARITGKPNQALALREALQTLEAATREEPGCREFSFFQALSDPDAFILLESFSNQDAFDEHLTMSHTREFFHKQLVVSVKTVSLR